LTDSAWATASDVFADAIREFHRDRGRNVATPSVTANVGANSALIPSRAALVEKLLAGTTEDRDLRGKRILEVGAGFGALSTYLAVAAGAERVVASDVRDDLLGVGERCAKRLQLGDRVAFRRADARDLGGMGRVDVVVVYGVLPFLSTGRDLQRALGEIRRTLRPDGVVVTYQPNRWTRVDSFPGDGRVRLVSPLELAVRGRVAGLRTCGVGGLLDDGIAFDGLRRYRGRRMAWVGRRPG
jgi:2-polyprenyl-3-methyl-5-hydroxy-6-metoxy-1,4-benzoquinol methylase